MKKIKSFDGTKINYDIHRISDFFLIFLHGAGSNLKAWDDERDYFHNKKISTVAIDLRGHGLSDKPNSLKKYRLENFAKDIYEIVKKEKISKFILIGHCFGGIAVINFHKLYPKLAKAYVLIDTTYKVPKMLKQFFKKNILFKYFINFYLTFNYDEDKNKSHDFNYDKFAKSGDLDINRLLTDIWNTSLRSWIFTFENIVDFNGIKTLKSINKPVLIIQGENDSIFNKSISKKLNKLIRNSKLKILPFENHMVVISNPKVLEKEIYSFLNKINKKITC